MHLKKIIRGLSAISVVLCAFVFAAIAVCDRKTADSYFTEYSEKPELSVANLSFEPQTLPSVNDGENNKLSATVKLFGIFPVKQVSITSVQRPETVPGGIAFGIKMLANDVTVAALNSFVSEDKIVCPAKEAGIRLGDAIVSINSQKIRNNAEVAKLVAKSAGDTLKIEILRQKESKTLSVKPLFDSYDQTYKIGLSVRDSSAGIGTVTFYNPHNSTFGGLGHAVCDVGESAVSLYKGSVAIAEIDSVIRGTAGSPGRLNGHFVSNADSGTILINDETGVYGTLENVKCTSKPIPVAFKQEIEVGKASIITTIDGLTPMEYEIEIEQIAMSSDRLTKNMVVRVTDKRLLAQTGGIVQGMSGSPIIQNGRLVGAVTHVFVNDSTRGYAIFAENMLETAQSVVEQELKEVS